MSAFIHPRSEGILVLDYGSQYTLLITRRLRELGFYAEIIDGSAKTEAPRDFKSFGIILSGGPDTVSEGGRQLPPWVLTSKVPVLGICYGMQLLVTEFSGKLRSGKSREFGKSLLQIAPPKSDIAKQVFKNIPSSCTVWMSHGDDMETLPSDFELVAKTDQGVAAAIAHKHLPLIGLQYHPEVQHSEFGSELLSNFATVACKAPRNWQLHSMVEATIQAAQQTVNKGKVLVACSGGVDSSVTVALITKALGPDRVKGVFIDTGLLRKNEVPWVSANLKAMGVDLEVIDAKDRFFQKLSGVSDPEAKRKIIGYAFIEEFEAYAKGKGYSHLGQGTLYPDVIESAGHGSGAKVIKSHHNVGGLPEKLAMELVEPFRFLFKDEVRRIGKELGLPSDMIDRHPFPGPGLAVRIPGIVDREKALICQEADDIFIKALREHHLYDAVWQAFVVLLPVKSVGVMGDNRTYQYACSLRAVLASDGMTAGVAELPMSFLTMVADRIVRNVDGINRVLYDVTSKPPATIEWE
ncbi:MAG: glutamine-hydrolyzing GMP synthase [Pseudomonadota bacterium]